MHSLSVTIGYLSMSFNRLADAINPSLLPSGQPHLLTETYMHNRRRLLNYYKHSALQLETGEEKEREGGKEGEVGVGVNRDESGTKKGRPARWPCLCYLLMIDPSCTILSVQMSFHSLPVSY